MRIIYLGLAVPNLDHYLIMYTELMVNLHEQGHDVLIVGPSLNNSKGIQLERGIKVLRVPTLKLFKVGKFQKGIANLLLPWQYKNALKNSGIDLNFDLVIMPTPPITLANLSSWFKKKYKSKVYLILRDIFPQNAIDLEIMRKNGIAYRYFRALERKMYKVSDIIGCMSPGNMDYVKKHNPDINFNKIKLLPNWSNLVDLLGNKEKQKIKNDLGWTGKFVVMFGGNIGKPQELNNIVQLAKCCIDYPDIYFQIYGGGNEMNNIKKIIQNENLQNIGIDDFLSRADFFRVLQAADVGLISLNRKFTIPNYPSKTLTYYNAKLPILASVDLNTDYGREIAEKNTGLWAEAGNTSALKSQLLRLYQNPQLRIEMGNNGYDILKNTLNTDKAAQTLFSHIQSGFIETSETEEN